MKRFEYTTLDYYEAPPYEWDVQYQHDSGWELVSIVSFKSHDTKVFRVYYKREVAE